MVQMVGANVAGGSDLCLSLNMYQHWQYWHRNTKYWQYWHWHCNHLQHWHRNICLPRELGLSTFIICVCSSVAALTQACK